MKADYRIQNEDGTVLNAGTGLESWFTIEQARKLVNYDLGQRIMMHDGFRFLFETF
jgi:hypothetical protein